MSEEKRFDMGVAADRVRSELRKLGVTEKVIFNYGRMNEDGSCTLYFTARDMSPSARVYPKGGVVFDKDISPKLDLQALRDENMSLKLQIENIHLRKKLAVLHNEVLEIPENPYRKYGEKYTAEIVIELEGTPRTNLLRTHLVTAYFSGMDKDEVGAVIERFLRPYNETAGTYNIMIREGV